MEDDGGSGAVEGQAAGGHLIEDGAEAEEIGARIDFFAAGLLGRHVGDGADGGTGAGEQGGVDGGADADGGLFVFFGQLGEAEVEDLGAPAGGDEDVGGLDVAVNDAFTVGGVEGVGDLNGDVEKLVVGEGASQQA